MTEKRSSAKTKQPEPTVMVCHWNGSTNRFFGKYRDPEETDHRKRWKKIPGGAFPPEFDTEKKALAVATRWYQTELADRALKRKTVTKAVSWSELCDLFTDEVRARVRGSGATKDEALKRTIFLKKSAVLNSRSLAEHDETIALLWVRGILAEPLLRKGKEAPPRDPLTVRNLKKILHEIYRFAQSKKLFPVDRRLPTDCPEVKAEIAGALKEKARIGKLTRVLCPVETARAVVNCEKVSELRRIMTRTYFFTGLRPGELHALCVGDFRKEFDVQILDVRRQWTLSRPGFPAQLTAPKSAWGRRQIPVHPSLITALEAWIRDGWPKHVGRAAKSDDFLFPTPEGEAFREERCDDFLADIELAGASPTHKGVSLDIYSLRHTFATVARRAGVSSDVRDYLLGHRPGLSRCQHPADLMCMSCNMWPVMPKIMYRQPRARPFLLDVGDGSAWYMRDVHARWRSGRTIREVRSVDCGE